MSTGRRTLRQNTRERLISSDFNRMQTFVGADANDALRGQMLRPVDDGLFPGVTFITPGPVSFAIDVSTVTAPLYGGIIDGLMVIVPAAAVSLIITPGEVLLIDPDGQPGSSNPNAPNPDDPICKYVNAPGIPVVGTLVWTPNPGPGVRVDVVECQRTDIVQETDNRDIFNPATGLFAPTTVTKVTDGNLTYRIRLGAAGGGLPAPALGWFPLAILSTPAGAPNLDTVTVWDVRNLLSDKAEPFAIRTTDTVIQERGRWMIDVTTPGQVRLSGERVVDAIGVRAGGRFIDTLLGSPLLLSSASYQAAGFVPIASSILTVYALFPLGYPLRWVQYYFAPTASAGGRVPGPYRGIIAISHVPSINGAPSLPVPLPTATGLGGSTFVGAVLAETVIDTASVIRGAVGDSRRTAFDGVQFTAEFWILGGVIGVVAGANPPTPFITFTLTPGVHYPFGATRVRLQCVVTFAGFAAAGGSNVIARQARLLNSATPAYYTAIEATQQRVIMAPAVGSALDRFEIDMPVGTDGLSAPSGPVQLEIDYFVLAGSEVAKTIASAFVVPIGWSFD